DDADFRQVQVVGRTASRAEFVYQSFDDGFDVSQVAVLDGEADVGRVVVHHVLDDVVDHDVGVGDGREDLRGDAGAVGDALDGHARQVLLHGRAGYDDVFHVRCLRDDPGAGVVVLRVADVDADVVLLGEFHGARLQHRCAEPGQL